MNHWRRAKLSGQSLFSSMKRQFTKQKPELAQEETSGDQPIGTPQTQVSMKSGSPVQFKELLSFEKELLNYLVRLDNAITSGEREVWVDSDAEDWLSFNLNWLIGKCKPYSDLFPDFDDMLADAEDGGHDTETALLLKHEALYWLLKEMGLLLKTKKFPRNWNASQSKIWADVKERIGKEPEEEKEDVDIESTEGAGESA